MSDSRETTIERQLNEGLSELGWHPDDRQRRQLLTTVSLLHKWNRAYNLTAIRSSADMVTRHLLDSAAIVDTMYGPRILDVGSGAGFPGLVIAILRPDVAVTLLDSNGKKVRFQRQVMLELGLTNVTPVQARVESFQSEPFEQIVSRAFASLGDFVTLSDHLLAPRGKWMAMKGPSAESECDGLPSGVQVEEVRQLDIPGEQGQRVLMTLSRHGDYGA
ncbi:16S rRNA (guanine(527)-N(7))-methyltransferase RsmG [Aidingimonas halophila]|uniref:Ribosomal RNA small subunit methyltransferase G n=1 Tax=Aidingimonas halophila TaxID=574349 RepID=A0A1H2XK58_9GAMM|nr:16S rRNA (guanine(527)-N(7))-methyltransferase RsmG [Aidingimonas halophila]GHC28887.1 ribosomal RNA small subunit methyltransferase G [Aidingimonas halophila]SDW93210.1 16S rRNA m(7)G-527 methyltransferase [Aidingimonas halophila]